MWLVVTGKVTEGIVTLSPQVSTVGWGLGVLDGDRVWGQNLECSDRKNEVQATVDLKSPPLPISSL